MGRKAPSRRPLEREGRRARPSPWQFDYPHLAVLASDLKREIGALLVLRPGETLRVIDVGSGASPYRAFLGDRARPFVRIDFDPRARPDVVAEAGRLPFRDGSFDLVLATQILQYLPDPARAVAEFRRVLAPAATALVSTHGRWPRDEDGERRWSGAGLVTLFTGFASRRLIAQEAGASALPQRINLRLRGLRHAAVSRFGTAGRIASSWTPLAWRSVNLAGGFIPRRLRSREATEHGDANTAALNFLVVARTAAPYAVPPGHPVTATITPLDPDVPRPLPGRAFVGEIELTSGRPDTDALSRTECLYLLLRRGGMPVGRLFLERPSVLAQPGRFEELVRTPAPGIGAVSGRSSSDAIPQPPPELSPDPVPLPFASVVVPTRDRPEDLERCLTALAALRYPRRETLIVDSAGRNPDDTEAIARRHGARCFREGEPGLSRARNRGLAESRGEIIAFLDDDCRADAGWLESIAQAFAATDADVVTGPLLPAEIATEAQRLFLRYTFMDRRGFDPLLFGPDGVGRPGGPRRPVSPVWPVDSWRAGGGGNLALRRRQGLLPDGFDLTLGAGTAARGGEDLAYFHRVVSGGGTICFEPRAIAWHRHWRGKDELRRLLFRHGAGHTAYAFACLRQGRTPLRLARYLAGFFVDRLSRLAAASLGARSFPPSLPAWELAGSLAGLWLAPLASRPPHPGRTSRPGPGGAR